MFILTLSVFLLIHRCVSFVPEYTCKVKGSCTTCIQTAGCAWCSLVKNNMSDLPESGCFSNNTVAEVCHSDQVEQPKDEIREVTKVPLRGSQGGEEPNQVYPQRVHINATLGKEYIVEIKFRKAENYPIDLYYLMDFSLTMHRFKNELSKLAEKLSHFMKQITSNFQIGFGSYVDKTVLPYVSEWPPHLKPDYSCSDKCVKPYSFRNHMKLSKNMKQFSDEIDKSIKSINIDNPEGSLDALLQAIVCTSEIGWREKARHLLVLATDAEFHVAGDGKLGGVVEPHDGKCHLGHDGYYTEALRYDYPSISLINHKASVNNFNIIFAVTKEVDYPYKQMSKRVQGSSVGLLKSAADIVNQVEQQYNKLSTTITLRDTARWPISVRYTAKCQRDNTWKDAKECLSVRDGEEVQFRAHIKVSECLEPGKVEEITIHPVGINDTLVVNLRTICDCSCREPGHPSIKKSSDYCSSHGDLVCGQCECDEDRIGNQCECSKNQETKVINNVVSTESCISSEGSGGLMCSGKGDCTCGVCVCDKADPGAVQYYGRYCQCDNFNCATKNGHLCSGNGRCVCNECICNSGWSGKSCDCPTDDTLCRPDHYTEVCSGRGECDCGECRCHNETTAGQSALTNKFCQLSMTCPEHCYQHKDCVECLSYQTGPINSTDCHPCNLTHHLVENVEDYHNMGQSYVCSSVDGAGCTFSYVCQYDQAMVTIFAGKAKSCPEKVAVVALVSGIIGSIVVAGVILLLIWKLVTTLHDKNEYVKFENERKKSQWEAGENPLYKTAVSTYKNPAYVKDEGGKENATPGTSNEASKKGNATPSTSNEASKKK